MKTEDKIQQQLDQNPIIIYMKGTPEKPECGFSAKAVGVLKSTGAPFAFVNVLQAPFIYERLPAFSDFPTFPQVFIASELIGGSDIVEDMLFNGELKTLIDAATGAVSA